MRFEFDSPTRVVFGAGALREAGARARPFGRRVLVVTGRNARRAQPLVDLLASAGMTTTVHPTAGEPTLDQVGAGVAAARRSGCDCVVGFGGGSALDAAKAIAAMTTNPGDLLDYLEVIGRGQPLQAAPLPFIAIPTTAGTGSEVTRNAVIGSPEHRVKVSLRSPRMPARVAIVDPKLTLDLPPDITATTGMDALTQCIEAYLSCKATRFTDAFALEGIRRAAHSLQAVFTDGGNLEARTDMALASLYSGIALANAGLGAVHGFAGPIGGMFPAPHGAVCAALLAPVMRMNLRALRARQPAQPVLKRFQEIGRWLTRNADADAESGIEWLDALKQDLGIPRLSQWRVGESDFDALVQKASAASSMKGNPVRLEETELRGILVDEAGGDGGVGGWGVIANSQ